MHSSIYSIEVYIIVEQCLDLIGQVIHDFPFVLIYLMKFLFWSFVSGLCLLLSLLYSDEPDLHTALKWLSFPHFPHFLPNTGQLPLLCDFPQYLQLLNWTGWSTTTLAFASEFSSRPLKLLVCTASYEIAAFMPKSFLCSILDSTFLNSSKHFQVYPPQLFHPIDGPGFL